MLASPSTPVEQAAVTTTATPTVVAKPVVTEVNKIDITTTISISNHNLGVNPTSGGGKKIAGSLGNMSMAESMDGSFYGGGAGYESTKNVNLHEADNAPVEARPKNAG